MVFISDWVIPTEFAKLGIECVDVHVSVYTCRVMFTVTCGTVNNQTGACRVLQQGIVFNNWRRLSFVVIRWENCLDSIKLVSSFSVKRLYNELWLRWLLNEIVFVRGFTFEGIRNWRKEGMHIHTWMHVLLFGSENLYLYLNVEAS